MELWVEERTPVLTVKVPVALPPPTMTDAGTLSPVIAGAPERLTAVPPEGAELERVTVQFVAELGPRLAGAQVTDETAGPAETRICAAAEDPFSEAVRVMAWLELTAELPTPKYADVSPAGTVTEAGMLIPAMRGLAERLTAAPPEGAAFDRTTLQLMPDQARMAAGQTNDETMVDPATSDNVVFAADPFSVAVITADSLAGTAPAFTAKEAVCPPDGTVTEAGTVNWLELEFMATVTPPSPATSLSVREQVVAVDGDSEFRLQPRALMATGPETASRTPASVSTGIALPAAETAMLPVSVTGPDADEDESPSETTPTTPDGIGVASAPVSTQVYKPAPPAQATVLPAADGPPLTLIELTLAAG